MNIKEDMGKLHYYLSFQTQEQIDNETVETKQGTSRKKTRDIVIQSNNTDQEVGRFGSQSLTSSVSWLIICYGAQVSG